jgi:hypothetical protein
MRFGTARSCPGRHAPAAGASTRACLQAIELPLPAFCYRTIVGAPTSPSSTLDFQLSSLDSTVNFRLSTRPSRLSPLRSQTPSHLVTDPCTSIALCFHNLTKRFSRNPFALIILQKPRGVTPRFANSCPVNQLPGASLRDRPSIRGERGHFRLSTFGCCPVVLHGRRRHKPTHRSSAARRCTAMMTAPTKKSTLPANRSRSQWVRGKPAFEWDRGASFGAQISGRRQCGIAGNSSRL